MSSEPLHSLSVTSRLSLSLSLPTTHQPFDNAALFPLPLRIYYISRIYVGRIHTPLAMNKQQKERRELRR